MIIVENNIIPFKGFKAMYFFGILFVRKGAELSSVDLNHEKIHDKQAKELLFVFFYLWYLLEWLVRLFVNKKAYRNICFEREAYANQDNLYYLEWDRKPYQFLKYLRDEEN